MSPLSVRCIKAALLSLAVSIGLGATFALDRRLGAPLRLLHIELNLWGWATLLIYGMAYHMLPRFAGRPLRYPRWAAWQSWLAIVGVGLAALGWSAFVFDLGLARWLLLGGGALQALAAILFALLIGGLLWNPHRTG